MIELAPPTLPRSPWQLLYGAAHRLRRHWWAGRAASLPRPVISVGNLHWGGGGKTPMTAALARHLRDRRQLAVAVLSRGYKSEGAGVRVVSDGAGPLLGPKVAGDEPVLLAGELPGVSVVVGPDRHRAGLHALARLTPPPGLFLLDDGFSHLGLARDLDLLVFPVADPFGGGRLAPGGRLREPLASSARADAALLTGDLPADTQELGDRLARALHRHGFRGPGFAAPTRPGTARRLSGEELAPGSRVVLASGIARPEAFAALARRQGFEVVRELPFGDHHDYPPSSLEAMARAVDESRADALLVTSKDRVKLLGELDLPLAELPVAAEPEPAFWRWLDQRLDHLFESGGG